MTRLSRIVQGPSCGCLLTLLIGCGGPPGENHWEPPADNWQLVWSDEFDDAEGSAPDPSKWGSVVWGYNCSEEKQFYTDRRENSYLDGSGHLVIEAREEQYEHRSYTSARLRTQGLMEKQYGAFEARIQLPSGKGIWPAFWLLGDGIQVEDWPFTGEIDVVELAGSRPGRILGSLHGPDHCGGGGSELCPGGPLTEAFELPAGQGFDQGFHVFRVEWLEGGVRWLVDGKPYYVREKRDHEVLGIRWVYDHPFFIIINVAVGGLFDGDPGLATTFPQRMLVDYVRVFDLPGHEGPLRLGSTAGTYLPCEFLKAEAEAEAALEAMAEGGEMPVLTEPPESSPTDPTPAAPAPAP
jgi:beta-glucanase (GH16 family)